MTAATTTRRSAALTPDQLLARYPAKTRAIANKLRTVLRRAVPTFSERALPGWKAISYRDPQAGYVCGIFPFERNVQLYIEFGASLEDPDGLMERRMKRGGVIVFETERDIRAAAIARLIRQAVVRQSV